jgi:RHS repeat-associated protein
MLARLIATVAALLLACASPQADAYVRAERVSMSLADLAAAEKSAPAAENAPPAKAASNPKTAPPARARPAEHASGKNDALTHCHVAENWSPLQKCASMPGVYQWDGTRLAGRTNATGSTLGDYQHAYGWAISSREGLIRSTLHTDVHGTPQLITDGTAAIAGWTRTDVWGVEKASTGQQSRLGHTGYLKDPLLGDELYAQARQYRAGVGRFTSRDEWAGDNLNPITLNKFLYGNGNPGSFWDLDGLAAAPPCASLPAGCVSAEELQMQQTLSEREATMVAGIDFDAPPELRQEPEGPGMSAPTESIPENGFEANARRSRQMRYEGNENSLTFDDRVGNAAALVCPWCTEKNELGIEQKVNPINRERLSTSEWDTAFQDVAGLVAVATEYFGRRMIARTLVEADAGKGSMPFGVEPELDVG